MIEVYRSCSEFWVIWRNYLALFWLVVGTLAIGWKWGVLCSEGYSTLQYMLVCGGNWCINASVQKVLMQKISLMQQIGINDDGDPTSMFMCKKVIIQQIWPMQQKCSELMHAVNLVVTQQIGPCIELVHTTNWQQWWWEPTSMFTMQKDHHTKNVTLT